MTDTSAPAPTADTGVLVDPPGPEAADATPETPMVAPLEQVAPAPTAPPSIGERDLSMMLGGDGVPAGRSLDLLHGVEMTVTVELGRTKMLLRDLLALQTGSVIELDRAAGSPVDVLINDNLLARGEVVVLDDEFGVRILDIVLADGQPAPH
jgi:flagellar motor switch protein FliN/FliY